MDSTNSYCVIGIVIFAFMPQSAGAINKCIDENGGVTYSAQPCPVNARASVLKDVSTYPPSSPQGVFLLYQNAVVRGDLTEIRKLVTGQLRTYYQDFVTLKRSPDASPSSIKIIETCITKDAKGAVMKAEGTVSVSAESTSSGYHFVIMAKEDKSWKVEWVRGATKLIWDSTKELCR